MQIHQLRRGDELRFGLADGGVLGLTVDETSSNFLAGHSLSGRRYLYLGRQRSGGQALLDNTSLGIGLCVFHSSEGPLLHQVVWIKINGLMM